MTTMASSLLPLSLCILLLCHGCIGSSSEGSKRGRSEESQCQRLEKLSALEPVRRLESEGGITEYFDENNEQLQCAGLTAFRRTIQPRGLLLPSYANAPDVVYFEQGRGICGIVNPGCPETYQSGQEQSESKKGEEQQRSSSRDHHQRIQPVRQGDIIAVPAGVSYWCYNDGESPVVAITIMRTGSDANQLDQNRRHFLLAGNDQQSAQQKKSTGNVFSGFDVNLLAEALGVDKELAQKIQRSAQQQKGEIFKVEKGLQVISPREEREEKEDEREEKEGSNGMEQAFCTMRFRQNIDNPSRADMYNPQGGRITILNNQKLPILNSVQLTVLKGVLNKDAMTVPLWEINAHNLIYVTRGRGRVQIVGDKGKSVFDGELRQGQLVVVPQNFAVIKQAKSERFEWVSIKTHENAMHFPIAGKMSFFRGLPEDVITNSYKGVSREEARMLKQSEEWGIVTPQSRQETKGDEA